MKLLTLFTLCLLSFAADPPKPEEAKPIAADQREIAHMAQKNLLASQLDLLRYREQPSISTAQLRAMEKNAQDAGQAWSKLLADLQAKSEAKNCTLDLELKWQCDPPLQAGTSTETVVKAK